MSSSLVPTEETGLGELSKFLGAGFGNSPSRAYFLPPEVLRWKFFGDRGPWPVPRSFMVRGDTGVEAHVGIITTEFCATLKPRNGVSAVHMTDWLADAKSGFLGAMLMFKAYSLAPVQYALGCSPSAREVILNAGFKEVRQVPRFHKVFSPLKRALWRELHGPPTLWPGAALLGADLLHTARGLLSGGAHGVEAHKVEQFRDEPLQIVASFDQPMTMTSRDPRLLNHLLAHPAGCISGWLLKKAGKVCGFALLSLLDKGGVKIGRVVEMFLDRVDPVLWRESLSALEHQLRIHRPDVISAYGSTP